MAKLQSGSVDFDVYFPSVTRLPILVSKQLVRPLNKDYVPNLAANVWPELVDPFYDKGAQYAVPYVVFATGMVWRNDKVTEDIGSMAEPVVGVLGVGEKYKGKIAILDDPRDALSLALFRENGTAGVDVNSEDPQVVAQGPAGPEGARRARQRQGLDRHVPDGAGGQGLARARLDGRPDRGRAVLHAEGRQARRAVVLEARRSRRPRRTT